MAEISGAQIIARSLKTQGVSAIYGVVGIPVAQIAAAAMPEGIKYVGMRHEMPATYAAQATSYLTGRLGASLVVSGPGALNATAAFANAWSNRWPMIMLGGAGETTRIGMGDFQEADLLTPVLPYAKFARSAQSIERLPALVAEAARKSLHGTPGPSFLDLPGDMISGSVEEDTVQWVPRVPDAPRPMADPQSVGDALEALKSSESPLVIIGKGVAWSRAEEEVKRFVEETGLPYLAMPMAKGILPDTHDQAAAAARSYVLQNADLIFLVGARLNWMLHYGLPPRFREDVRVVQLDINSEEIGVNVAAEVSLVGDAKATMAQLLDALDQDPWKFPDDSEWTQSVKAEAARNGESVQAMMDDDSTPMGYYRSLKEIRDALPEDTIIVAEGASTMDISRTVLDNFLPRHRLDAGSFGSMGLGHGFAIAAQVVHPDKKVLALQGDAAFGFAGMEVEVAVRHKLPITWVVFVNNGIGGNDVDMETAMQSPGAFVPNARYDKVIEAFGGKGYHVETPDEFASALKDAVASDETCLINVALDPAAQRKPQKFAWLTR
ncbi:MAG TPA: thiamine pyrophosphate-binding protein [Dehalococcoidia bacterium]|nr:thiamine pyrophosphate-binding protein [Dehalococcoidia bacterium]